MLQCCSLFDFCSEFQNVIDSTIKSFADFLDSVERNIIVTLAFSKVVSCFIITYYKLVWLWFAWYVELNALSNSHFQNDGCIFRWHLERNIQWVVLNFSKQLQVAMHTIHDCFVSRVFHEVCPLWGSYELERWRTTEKSSYFISRNSSINNPTRLPTECSNSSISSQ